MHSHSGAGYGSGYGECYGSRDGDGYGSGYGSGYGDGSGGGSGEGYGEVYGSGDGDEMLPLLAGHPVSVARPWRMLRIGCECHTFEEWAERADEIDALHGDGIADQTRALALRLIAEAEGA